MWGMYGDDYDSDSHLRNPDGSKKKSEYSSRPDWEEKEKAAIEAWDSYLSSIDRNKRFREEQEYQERARKQREKLKQKEKADKLKSAKPKRDVGGSKKTLRAFLKEKSEKKVSKTHKTSAKKQAERE